MNEGSFLFTGADNADQTFYASDSNDSLLTFITDKNKVNGVQNLNDGVILLNPNHTNALDVNTADHPAQSLTFSSTESVAGFNVADRYVIAAGGFNGSISGIIAPSATVYGVDGDTDINVNGKDIFVDDADDQFNVVVHNAKPDYLYDVDGDASVIADSVSVRANSAGTDTNPTKDTFVIAGESYVFDDSKDENDGFTFVTDENGTMNKVVSLEGALVINDGEWSGNINGDDFEVIEEIKMDEQISDARLQIMLRNFIHERAKDNPFYSGMFNGFLSCGKKLNPNNKVKDVIVITNGERSKILGTMHCNNPWFCPHCSTVQMSKHAARIATAIDALKRQGQLAFMLTLTVPHHRGITCNEITEILFNTWHNFIIYGNRIKKTRGKQLKRDGTNKTFTTKNPFAQFCTQLQCKHRVRVIEYTWGANGWHPHMHCLFWLPKKNLQMSLAWEHDLRMNWLQIAEKQTIKTLCKRRNANTQSIIEETHRYFEQTIMLQDQQRLGVHISDHDGIVTAQDSSQYICGWGADQELTGNYHKQASKEGHMTPYQILTAAYNATDNAERTKWLELYMEYAVATKQRSMRRVQFSRTGILKIVAEYRLTEAYTETIKKKFMEKAKWTAVVWFNSRQWSEILLCRENKYLVADIIERAHLPDAREQITELLLQYDIDIRYNNPADKQEFIDNYINNPDFIAA